MVTVQSRNRQGVGSGRGQKGQFAEHRRILAILISMWKEAGLGGEHPAGGDQFAVTANWLPSIEIGTRREGKGQERSQGGTTRFLELARWLIIDRRSMSVVGPSTCIVGQARAANKPLLPRMSSLTRCPGDATPTLHT